MVDTVFLSWQEEPFDQITQRGVPGDRRPTFVSRYIKSRVRGRNRWSQSIHRKVQRPIPLYHSTMHQPSQGIASAFTA